MADVFISYSHKSAKVANTIADALEDNNISPWIDKRNMKTGKFPGKINRAIKGCKVFLLVLDKNSVKSEHVENEVALAFNSAKELVPFQTQKCEVPEDMEYYIVRYNIVDGIPPDEIHIQNLVERVANFLGVEIIPKKPLDFGMIGKVSLIVMPFIILSLLRVILWLGGGWNNHVITFCIDSGYIIYAIFMALVALKRNVDNTKERLRR